MPPFWSLRLHNQSWVSKLVMRLIGERGGHVCPTQAECTDPLLSTVLPAGEVHLPGSSLDPHLGSEERQQEFLQTLAIGRTDVLE